MNQVPDTGSHNLRIGRNSITGCFYFLTASTFQRKQVFQSSKCAQTVLSSVHYLNRTDRFTFDAAVVMPDHIHLAGQLGSDCLERVIHSLKSFTAHKICNLGYTAPVWQAGFHDHALRRDEDYRRSIEYLLNNPVRAGLVADFREYPHWWCRFEM